MYMKNMLRYRSVWLGIALIWVMLFHCPLDMGPFYYFKSIGYGGVDICLFASGIGCFFSLSAESDPVCFMKRRIKRLVPTYLVFIVFWLAFQAFAGDFGFQMAIGNILAVQDFTGLGNSFNWYISAIFLLYLLAPYFKIIVDKASKINKILFLIFLIVFSIPFWNAENYLITITRLPIFYIGMLFADMCVKGKTLSRKHGLPIVGVLIFGIGMLLALILLFPDYLWSHGLYWYPFIVITPPLCLTISSVSALLEKCKITKPIVAFLSLCGEYSFELYLVHILIKSCTTYVIRHLDLSAYASWIWLASIVPVFVCCFLLRKLTTLLTGLFNKTKKQITNS